MKKPQLLEIRSEDMHWFRPSRKARIKMLKNRIIKAIKAVWRFMCRIVGYSALPILVAFLYVSITNYGNTSDDPKKYQRLTLNEQLDYYQALAKK